MGRIVGCHFAEKIVKGACGALFLEFFRRTVGDDDPAIDDDCPGACGFYFFENVRGKQNGLVFSESLNQLTHFMLLVWIKAVGRLV